MLYLEPASSAPQCNLVIKVGVVSTSDNCIRESSGRSMRSYSAVGRNSAHSRLRSIRTDPFPLVGDS